MGIAHRWRRTLVHGVHQAALQSFRPLPAGDPDVGITDKVVSLRKRIGEVVGGRGEGQDEAAKRDNRPGLAISELERLRWLIVQAMDNLAEQVLGQIQTTRDIAEQTESLLLQVQLPGTEPEPGDRTEHHLRQVRNQIEEAIRNIPESSWDDFAQTCTQLARTVRRVQDVVD
jgi:hypothetical protein